MQKLSPDACCAGKSFSYAEGQAAPNFAVAYFIAGLYQLFGLLLFLRPLKSFWIWLLPRIGVPPGNFVKKYGSWDARVVAESEPDKSGKTVTATAILKVRSGCIWLRISFGPSSSIVVTFLGCQRQPCAITCLCLGLDPRQYSAGTPNR